MTTVEMIKNKYKNPWKEIERVIIKCKLVNINTKILQENYAGRDILLRWNHNNNKHELIRISSPQYNEDDVINLMWLKPRDVNDNSKMITIRGYYKCEYGGHLLIKEISFINFKKEMKHSMMDNLFEELEKVKIKLNERLENIKE